MTYKIEEIEGIGDAYAAKLETAGVKTTADLLEQGKTSTGRKKLAESSGIDSDLILRWCNHADLMRINGIGKQYAELMEAAGVDTIKELRTRNAANLAAKMREINDQKNLAKTQPTESMVQGFIDQAKQLEPILSY